MSAQCVVQGPVFGRPFRYGMGYLRRPKICNLRALELLHGQKLAAAEERLMPPKSILVDHCCLNHGRTTQMVNVEQRLDWGHTQSTVKVAMIRGRRRQPQETWLREEIRSLASVCDAIRKGVLVAYTSMELSAERMRSTMRGQGIQGDLWDSIRLEHVDSPLDRSTWMGGLTLEKMTGKDHKAAFYDRLLAMGRDGVPREFIDHLGTSEFVVRQLKNLGRLGDFVKICKAVGRPRYGDAFHLWTALCCNLDFFLTTDKMFLEQLRRDAEITDLAKRAITPSELVAILGLPPTELPVKENEVVPFLMAAGEEEIRQAISTFDQARDGTLLGRVIQWLRR